MINNRQQSGRRRGRGGQQRPQNGQGRSDQGSRIDNRARGNAAQLLEKYKTLARDAQTQGDRVMTEYYHQFADHYFRVVSETKARFEDSQPRRPRDDDFDDDGSDDYRAEDSSDGYDAPSAPQQQPAQEDRSRNRPAPRREQGNESYASEGSNAPRGDYRPEPRNEARPEPREAREPRESREPRETREPREPRAPRSEPRAETPRAETPRVEAAPEEAPRVEIRERRPRADRIRRPAAEANGNVAAPEAESVQPDLGFADRLPPAFAAPQPADVAEEAPAPRPRVRRVRKAEASEAPAEG